LLTKSHMIPGAPYSGPCLPKDYAILYGMMKDSPADYPVLTSLKTENEKNIESLVSRWGDGEGPYGLVGLSFRPGALEFRHSLGLELVRRLKKNRSDAEILIYEPSLPEDL